MNSTPENGLTMSDEILYLISFCLGGDLFFSKKVNGVHAWTKTPYGNGSNALNYLMGQEFKSLSFYEIHDVHDFFENKLEVEAVRWFPTFYRARVRDCAFHAWGSQYKSWRKSLD